MAPRITKLKKLDVVVTAGAQVSEVHLASPEALAWVERNVALDRRVIVTSLRWPNDLVADITGGMERDGLTVERQTESAGIGVKIIPNERGNPLGKLADTELHFTEGLLEGLKLIGFAVWERRGGGRTVTFPARQYSVNGERRSFALLRPLTDAIAQDRVRDLILQAYADHESGTERGR
jgi:sporulation protein YlmC with PRC-barrel domain